MKQGLARAIAVLTVAFASAAAHAQTIPDHPHFWGGGWGWGHMIFGPLMMIAFVGAIVVVAMWDLVDWLGGQDMQRYAVIAHAVTAGIGVDVLVAEYERHPAIAALCGGVHIRAAAAWTGLLRKHVAHLNSPACRQWHRSRRRHSGPIRRNPP